MKYGKVKVGIIKYYLKIISFYIVIGFMIGIFGHFLYA